MCHSYRTTRDLNAHYLLCDAQFGYRHFAKLDQFKPRTPRDVHGMNLTMSRPFKFTKFPLQSLSRDIIEFYLKTSGGKGEVRCEKNGAKRQTFLVARR